MVSEAKHPVLFLRSVALLEILRSLRLDESQESSCPLPQNDRFEMNNKFLIRRYF